jgi:hypothetical protein
MSITGPQAGDFPLFNIFEYGVGVAPIPFIMPFYSAWSSSTSEYSYGYSNSGTIFYNTIVRSMGIAIQEPRFGLFGSWRYGIGDVGVRIEGSDYSNLLHTSDITTYSLALGFYGQWGKVEYRHMRITSFSNPTEQFEIPTVTNGLYWTLQVML